MFALNKYLVFTLTNRSEHRTEQYRQNNEPGIPMMITEKKPQTHDRVSLKKQLHCRFMNPIREVRSQCSCYLFHDVT